MKSKSTSIVAYRKYFFIALYQTVLYLPLALLIVGKNANFQTSFFNLFIFFVILSLIPIGLFIYRFKSKKLNLQKYKILLIVANIPIILGFIITIFSKNYIYLMLSFPITIFAIFTLIPIKKWDS
jgi:uncharacterized membrane protein